MKISEIHSNFTVAADPPSRGNGVTPEEMKVLYPFCPDDYLSLISELDGFSLYSKKLSLHIMSSDDAVSFSQIYPFLKNMGQCFFFATDGDLSYFYSIENGHDCGVYRVETSAAFWSEAEFVARTIREMLVEGTGLFED